MKKIFIFDTTLRDGEQSAGTILKPGQKIKIARQLEKLGVDVIEAGFPASSPADFKAVYTISKNVRGPVIAALARCVERDIRIAADALKSAEKPRIHIFLPVSDINLRKKIGKTREEALKIAAYSVKLASSFRKQQVEYSPEDATRSEFNYLVKVINIAIASGAKIINIPDTVGYSTPEEFGRLIKRLKNKIPKLGKEIIFSVHCHNDLGMATANSLAAINNGANQIECTVNGVGERAGNCALEEIVMAIKTRGDLYGKALSKGINTKEIKRTSQLVSDLLAIPIQPNKAIVGKNAFAHSSGVHQDGVLKDRQTYEIINPEEIGLKKSEIVLTARSGRHGLLHKLKSLGHTNLSKEELEKAYENFIKLADKGKLITKDDLDNIISSIKIPR